MRTLSNLEQQLYAEVVYNLGDLNDGDIKRKYTRVLNELITVRRLGFSIAHELRRINEEILEILIYDEDDKLYKLEISEKGKCHARRIC